VLTAASVRTIKTPVQAPRANAIAERFVGSIRRELLDRTLIINQRHAITVLGEYQHHYNSHRPHRTLGQAAPLRPLPQRTTSEANTVPTARPARWTAPRVSAGRVTCAALLAPSGLPWRRASVADDRVARQELGYRSCDGLGTLDL
jgi:hypothetical protein